MSVELKEREIEALELSAIRWRRVLTAGHAALYKGLSKSYLLGLARDQQIEHNKCGKYTYFRTEDLDKWIAGKQTQTAHK